MIIKKPPVNNEEYERSNKAEIPIKIKIIGHQVFSKLEKSMNPACCNKNPIPTKTNKRPIQILVRNKLAPFSLNHFHFCFIVSLLLTYCILI